MTIHAHSNFATMAEKKTYLSCLSFLDLRLLITPFVSPNLSIVYANNNVDIKFSAHDKVLE